MLVALAVAAAAAPAARADFAVLRNGQRLHISSYERRGDRVILRVEGGEVEISAADLVAIEPEEFLPVVHSAPQPPPVGELIEDTARRYGLDPALVSSVVAVESDFNPKAVSRRNARGLMQLMPETADKLGVTNVFDPVQNVDGGTRYLKWLMDWYKDLGLSLAAYNAGPQQVARYGGVPPFAETISYVRKVQREYLRRKLADAAGKTPANRAAKTPAKPVQGGRENRSLPPGVAK
jgi:hypothetical protein